MHLFSRIKKRLSIDGAGDLNEHAPFGSSIGVVVGTDDPLQQGRLQIYCPALNDDPKKVQHLPWAVYVSPFGGSIRNASHTKGHDPSATAESTGTTQYGFWAIPEMGAHVLVNCIDGNPRKRAWLGCIYEHQETAGVLNGVYDWGAGGKLDGPFCSPGPGYEDERSPLEPLYTNQSEAFNDDKKSPEWKTRAADYSGSTNVDIESFGTNEQLSNAEQDDWVKGKLGAQGYDWSGFKNLGAYLASRIFGFMSPGQHSMSFDDRPFNSRIRIRTTAGNQIILDDTNERIYISTFEGKSWVELDRSGNIDMYGERRISVHSEKDLNLSSDETVRIKGKKGVHIYSGDNEGQNGLRYTPEDGEVRIHAAHDIHILSERTYRQYSKADTKIESRGTTHLTTHELFVHATPSSEYLDEGDGGGIYIMGDNEVYVKTPINTVSLTPTIGIQLASNLNILLNAGQEIIQVSNLGIVVDNTCLGGLLESPNPMTLETMPYGIGIGDFGCTVPASSGLFKIDLGGNITMQTVADTLITRGTDALGDKFSTSIKSINDTADEFKDLYNETVKSLQDHLLDNEIAVLALQAAGALTSTSLQSEAFIAMLGLIKSPPTLEGLAGVALGKVQGMFPIPDLGLPDLCMPVAALQITVSYDVVGFIEDDLGIGPISMSMDEGLLMGSDLKFGDSYDVGGDGGGSCHSSLSDIEFALWPNRVPEHEPWARVLKQDKGDTQNEKNRGYINNVDSIDQYDNEGEAGRKFIGVVEGEETIVRGEFWRR